MPRFSASLFTDHPLDVPPNPFWDSEPLLFADATQDAYRILTALTYKVSKKPRNLMAHLRRIYFCYQNALSEPLYAALLDLLIVLNGKGRKISTRLILGSQSQLDTTQRSVFRRAVDYPHDIPGNRYSLFTTGKIGVTQLVQVQQQNQPQYDCLALANDFIEYSQLDEAMVILERGLEEQPGRQDLQSALLELYRSTHSNERFKMRYETLKAAGVPLIEDWRELADFFDGKAI